MSEVSLFNAGDFLLHSAGRSSFKIDCDALTDADLDALAVQVARQLQWSTLTDIPRGGTRFARALSRYPLTTGTPRLIVDDVFTTGASMESARTRPTDRGVVIFARGPVPSWVYPMFTSWEVTGGE